jgi:hypothetical protein
MSLLTHDREVSDHNSSHESIEQAVSKARQGDGRGSGASITVYKPVEQMMSC